MKILVVNAGSSSLKYQLFDMDTGHVLAKGNCERIGAGGVVTHKKAGAPPYKVETALPDHEAALKWVLDLLVDPVHGVLADIREIDAVGHRVAHGGEKYKASTLIDDEVIAYLESIVSINPLHGPPAIKGMQGCRRLMGDTPQVGVFDTAFYAGMEDKAYIYPLPYRLYEEKRIRRYGFHGTSHRYVSQRCLELLGKPDGKGTRLISCHFGNGSSVTAIKDGKVIDTTMGLTPLDGFMMGTRSGAVDPSVVTYIMEKEGLTPHEMDQLLNKQSGMLGISGVSSDDRDIAAAVEAGNERAKLAWNMRTYEIIKYIGGYIAALGGVDALIFTAGIGENQPDLRAEIIRTFEFYGMKLDEEKNKVHGVETEITTPDSSVRAFVIPTNEELVIARDTKAIIEGKAL